MNQQLLNTSKGCAVILSICVIPVFLLNSLGFNRLLVSMFSISMLLLWTDGLMTLYALNRGASEINPVINLLNRIKGKKMGVLASRLVGSVVSVVFLVQGNFYALLVVAWMFAAVVCLNSVTLLNAMLPKEANTENA